MRRKWACVFGAVAMWGSFACEDFKLRPGPGRITTSDLELARRLAPASGTWQREGRFLTSPGWRSAKMGPFFDLAARLPAQGDGVLRVGIGQSEDYTVALIPNGARPSTFEDHDGRGIYREVYL